MLAVPLHLQEPWAERIAIMVIDGGLLYEEAERLAWAGLQAPGAAPLGACCFAAPREHPLARRSVGTRVYR